LTYCPGWFRKSSLALSSVLLISNDGCVTALKGLCHMRSSRIAVTSLVLALLSLSLSGVGYPAHLPNPPDPEPLSFPAVIVAYHGTEAVEAAPSADDLTGGIKEDIPTKYAARYREWKTEFLSTDAGRSQWMYYQNNPHFSLTIAVTRENAEGATTGKYRWNDAGQLTAATITLGMRLDEGYPNPIYFPVMNSLGPTESSNRINGNTLAATKIAHEFGHVNRTGKVDSTMYQLQSQMIPQYNKIFLTNGRNPNDPRLLEMAQKIGGTPVEIWEDREYWGEANAMVYLRDRFTDESVRCTLFSKIKHSVDLYAKNYELRFLEIARATPSRKICGWP
jgi:YD repeat-containing protein